MFHVLQNRCYSKFWYFDSISVLSSYARRLNSCEIEVRRRSFPFLQGSEHSPKLFCCTVIDTIFLGISFIVLSSWFDEEMKLSLVAKSSDIY